MALGAQRVDEPAGPVGSSRSKGAECRPPGLSPIGDYGPGRPRGPVEQHLDRRLSVAFDKHTVRLIEPRRPLPAVPVGSDELDQALVQQPPEGLFGDAPVATQCRVAVRAQEAAMLDERSRDPEVSPKPERTLRVGNRGYLGAPSGDRCRGRRRRSGANLSSCWWARPRPINPRRPSRATAIGNDCSWAEHRLHDLNGCADSSLGRGGRLPRPGLG